MSTNAKSLIASSDLDPNAISILSGKTLQAQMDQALGVNADDITATEAVLINILRDDSGSMSGLSNVAIDGTNLILDSLKGSKQSLGVLVHLRDLCSGSVYPYKLLSEVPKADHSNYNADGPNTPLYDQSLVILGAAAAKVQELADAGVPTRSITVIITDGLDNHSTAGPRQVETVIKSLLAQENHIVCGVGIGGADFKQVFRQMGIPDQWILTPSNTESEVRKAFAVVSQSAVRASQTAGSFSQTALGGFMV